MSSEREWDFTSKALSKSLVLSLNKKDLIEVLQHVKVIQQSNKQSFLFKSQFFSELSYNRVLEFNELLQEQRFYPGDIVYDQGSESTVFYIVKRGALAV
mmetsp:Transcript_18988/g.29129  ORF Transcript_18988/g.29129 Transcript_18988/m.29129 type:complete len:99 (+) Transcript_18988:83-379(+)